MGFLLRLSHRHYEGRAKPRHGNAASGLSVTVDTTSTDG
jgi:hypothetical protein